MMCVYNYSLTVTMENVLSVRGMFIKSKKIINVVFPFLITQQINKAIAFSEP